MWPRLTPSERALSSSQGGTMAGLPFICCSVSPQSRFDAQVFRVVLLRSLWCPLPLSGASCRCGRPPDSRGHHRAACPLAGVLVHRGFSLESAAVRMCREAGVGVSLNDRVHDLDLLPLGNRIIDESRSLLTGCHCSTGRSWQWTHHGVSIAS